MTQKWGLYLLYLEQERALDGCKNVLNLYSFGEKENKATRQTSRWRRPGAQHEKEEVGFEGERTGSGAV